MSVAMDAGAVQGLSGIRRKIRIAFILQVASISFATVLGVYGASAVLKHVLIQRALTDEAEHFWRRHAINPRVELPDTFNMTGFLRPAETPPEQVPEHLLGLEPGYHSLPRTQGGALVLVQDRPAGRLFLEFKQEQVDKLAFFFGAVPLAFVLLVIYLIAWSTYRVSRRAVSPVSWLADVVQRWDPKRPNIDELTPTQLPLDVDGEVLVLANGLHIFGQRIAELLERERNFTRDASHELRTPLTVIRMACDVMLAEDDLPAHAQRSLQRILRSARDMEALIESLLILARECEGGLPEEDFLVNDIVCEEADRAAPLLVGKPVELRVEHAQRLSLHASPRALAVVLSNLIRNACIYTDSGVIVVRVEADGVVVADSGPGMDPDELGRVFEPFFRGGERSGDGHGVGLSIVQRMSERFGWPVTLESELGQGTRASVRFPQSRLVDK